MIDNILAETVVRTIPLLIGLAAYVFIFALIIICLMRASRYFMNASKEQKLIRMELGKVAEEVHQLRQDMKAKTE